MGDLYDTSTVTYEDRLKCFVMGHDVRDWGTLYGWCHRCKHTVHSYGRRRVLYYGRYYTFPPKHRPRSRA